MDFAPYQSSPPEHNRPFSPPTAGSNPTSPRASTDHRRAFSPSQQQRGGFTSPPPLQHPQPQRSWQSSGLSGAASPPSNYNYNNSNYNNNNYNYNYNYESTSNNSAIEGGFGNGGGGGVGSGTGYYRDGVSEFATSLGIRLDYEAALAYLALPPLGAILLLILERNSDYVRFHAWQAALLFTAVLVVHLVVSASRFLSWLLFLLDLGAAVWLALRAYQDADTLDRLVLFAVCCCWCWIFFFRGSVC